MTNPSEVVVSDEDEAAALVALVRLNVPPHIQEVLIYGSKTLQIPPRILRTAIAAAIARRVPAIARGGLGKGMTRDAAEGFNACRERVLKGE